MPPKPDLAGVKHDPKLSNPVAQPNSTQSVTSRMKTENMLTKRQEVGIKENPSIAEDHEADFDDNDAGDSEDDFQEGTDEITAMLIELQGENETLTDEMERLQKALRRAEDDNTHLEKTCNEQLDQQRQLEMEVENLTNKLEDLNLTRRDAERSLGKAKEENQQQGKTVNEFMETNQRLEAQIERMGRDCQVLVEENRGLKGHKGGLQAEVKVLKDKADKLQAANAEYRTLMARLEEENRTVKDQMQMATTKLAHADQKILDLQGLSPEVDKLKSLIQSLQSELDKEKISQQQVNSLIQAERENHQVTAAELALVKARVADESQYGNTRFENAQRVFENEIASLRGTVKDLRSSVSDLEESKRRLQSQLSVSERESEALRREKESLAEARQESQNKYLEVTKTVSDLESRLRDAEKKKRSFESDLSKEKALNSKLTTEIDIEREQHQAADLGLATQRQQFEAEIARLKKKVGLAESKSRENEEKFQNAQSESLELERKIARLDSEVQVNKDKAAEANKKRSKVKQELDAATQKLKESSPEILQEEIKNKTERIKRLRTSLKEAQTQGSHVNCVKEQGVLKLMSNFRWLYGRYITRLKAKQSVRFKAFPDALARAADGKLYLKTKEVFYKKG